MYLKVTKTFSSLTVSRNRKESPSPLVYETASHKNASIQFPHQIKFPKTRSSGTDHTVQPSIFIDISASHPLLVTDHSMKDIECPISPDIPGEPCFNRHRDIGRRQHTVYFYVGRKWHLIVYKIKLRQGATTRSQCNSVASRVDTR